MLRSMGWWKRLLNWLLRTKPICPRCSSPMEEYHGTGYLVCPKCGEFN